MEIISANKLKEMNSLNKRKFEQLLPEIVKRLILASNSSVIEHRFPSGDDIWAPGYDGIANCENASDYVCKGRSVWEFGTNEDSLSKINEDYEKRTRDSLGVNKAETGFYLVIPKVWAYRTSLTEWISKHNDWAFTKVYDAVALSDWLNSEPTVCLWLLEEIYGDTELDFASVSTGWTRFSKKTNPPFVKEMFTFDRKDQIIQFKEKLQNESGDIIVKAPTRIDSVGFALSVIAEEEEYAQNSIVVNNLETFRRVAEIAEGRVIILTYPHEGEVFNGKNRIVLCYNKEATSISDAIELPMLSKSSYEAALTKMGISDSDKVDLFAFTHGNLRALIRRIPGSYVEQKPEWSNKGSLDALIPLVMLRSINKDKDQKLVERLSGSNFEDIEKQYYSLALMEDSPVKIVHNHYVITNYEEAWSTLALTTAEIHFNKLVELLNDLFGAICNTGNFDGRTVYDYKNIISSLMWNFVYYAYDKDEDDRLGNAVQGLLQWCYEPAVSSYIVENMSFLAMARHEMVMEFLSNDYSKKDGIIRQIFDHEDLNDLYCRILNVFDDLVLYSDTFPEACRILFDLFFLDKKYRYSTSPEESILDALCLWRCEGTVTIKQKEKVITSFLSKYPEKTIVLFAKLIRKDSYYKGVRIGERRISGERITVQDLIKTKERLMRLLFDKSIAIKRASIILSLLENYRDISPELLAAYADLFSVDEYDSLEVDKMNYWLRERVFSIKRFGWEESKKYVSPLEKWIKATEYQDDLQKSAWIFRTSYECPAEELLPYADDYERIDRERFLYRKHVFADLLSVYGDKAIDTIVDYIPSERPWGRLFVEVVPKDKCGYLLNKLFDGGKFATLAEVLDELQDDTAEDFLKVLDKNRSAIVPLLYNKKFLCCLTDNEIHHYWAHKEMLKYDSDDYAALLKHNPCGLLLYLYLESEKRPDICIEMTTEVFSAVMESDLELCRRYKDEMISIIAHIDKVHYSDAWAELCLNLVKKEIIAQYPKGVCTYLFRHPNKVKDIVLSGMMGRYSFNENFRLPEEAYNDYGSFKFFFDSLKSFDDESFKHVIGTILGKNIKGSDGHFPHEFIRRLLEEYDSRELDGNIAALFEGLYGMRTVEDGMPQRKLAKEYLDFANELQIDYPHSAYVLRLISKGYENEANSDYVHSEVMFY